MIGLSNVDYFDIGQRMQRLRKEAGFTQVEIAELVGISASHYGNIERGKRIMSIETFIKICFALDASADYILANKIPDNDIVIKNIISAAKRGGQENYLEFIEFVKKIAHYEFQF